MRISFRLGNTAASIRACARATIEVLQAKKMHEVRGPFNFQDVHQFAAGGLVNLPPTAEAPRGNALPAGRLNEIMQRDVRRSGGNRTVVASVVVGEQ